jgi:hypothetical protein
VDEQLTQDVRWTVFPTLLAQHRQSRSAQRTTAPWGALGTHNNEKRRPTLEDVERRFRRSAAVFGTY